ncbi:hypothetical protein [uncultured Algibacter sp.]|jgi:hypothetical protein|uniref:hypothetical protein n=1 Tax=uncultured Algibacter sp. TaxID=298659 RepID=UPI0026342789|nr:hypothetical protein [uncultured Algibacter sp.]
MRINFSIIVLLFSSTLFCQNTSCLEFKTGKYIYSNPEYTNWTITRTDSTQIETNNKTGIEIISTIDWISDCSYILTCKSVSTTNLTNIIGKVFHVSITETSKERYKCVSKRNDVQPKDLFLEMIKIK